MATTTTNASRAVADEVLGLLGRARQSRVWLSAACGIPMSTLGRRLNYDSPFTIDELVRVADALDVRLADVIRPLMSASELDVAA